MFRDLSATNTTPFHLSQRRRHQPRPDLSLQPNSHFHRPFSGADGAGGSLDMSMHRPRAPYNNRFASLATLPVEHRVSGRNRRPRNSRGARDAKRRRDARRSRQNGAVQVLDERLSRTIDQTLTMANIHPVPAITTAPDAWKADLTFNWPSWTRLPPIPPQLPVLDLGDLDLNHYALPAAVEQRLPPTPPAVTPSVPVWCPYIPSLMRDGGWNGEVPRFTDLSSLSERKQTSKMDSLIRWPVFKAARPRKQSRFFPSLTTSVSAPTTVIPSLDISVSAQTSVIKSSRSGCTLHPSEQASQDPLSTTWSDTFAREVVPCIKPRDSRHIAAEEPSHAFTPRQDCTRKPPSPVPDSTNTATAANLWSILSEDGWLTRARTRNEEPRTHYHESDTEDSEDAGGVPISADLDQPLEPESTPIPYVHLNSLVGHANETGEYGTALEDHPIFSALYLAEILATPSAGTPLCEIPATPHLHTPSSSMLRTVVPGKDVANKQDTLVTQQHDGMVNLDEHFASEQDLYMPENIMFPHSRADRPVDPAAFLSTGHDEHCGESPVLIEENELLEVEDDDWLDWSTLGDDESPTPLPATVVDFTDEDERDFTRHFCASASDWDEVHPCAFAHGLEFEDEVVEDFLGY